MGDYTPLCPVCESSNLVQQIGSAPEPHYGSVECGDCGAWVRWLPNPTVTQQFVERYQLIESALASGRVSGWELMFLNHIKKQRHLTPKQREKFEQICKRHQ